MYHLALILIDNLLPDQVHSRASKVVLLVLDLLWLGDVLHQSVLNTGDVKITLKLRTWSCIEQESFDFVSPLPFRDIQGLQSRESESHIRCCRRRSRLNVTRSSHNSFNGAVQVEVIIEAKTHISH